MLTVNSQIIISPHLFNIHPQHTVGKSLNSKAQSITRSIISDHTNGSRVLSTENFALVKKVITERVKWHRSMDQWEFVCEWCDALDMLICNGDLQCKIALSLIKADSLISLNEFDGALAASEIAISLSKSSKTLEMHFKALLHARKPVDIAVQRFVQLIGEEKSNNPLIEYTDGCLEKLSRIMACVAIAQSSMKVPDPERNRATRLLHKEWMRMYATSQMWKSMPQNEEADFQFGEESHGNQDIQSPAMATYLKVAMELGTLFLSDYMQRKKQSSRLEGSRFDCRSSSVRSHSAVNSTAEDQAYSTTPQSNLQQKTSIVVETVTCTDMVLYSIANNSIVNLQDECEEESSALNRSGDELEVILHSRTEEAVVAELEPLEVGRTVASAVVSLPATIEHQPFIGANQSAADYFFFGVDDSGQELDEDNCLYSFSCTLKDIRCEILSLLQEIAANIESVLKATGTTSHLGDTQDISWLAKLGFNLGKLLLDPQLCIFETSTTVDPQAVQDMHQRFELAAEFFEIAETLYSNIPLLVESSCESKRCHCLLIAAAARLQMENMPAATAATTKRPREDNPDKSAQYETPPRTKQRVTSGATAIIVASASATSLPISAAISGGMEYSNLSCALKNIHKAVEILKQHSDFEDASTRTVRKQLVLLEFACLCKSMDIKRCQQFVREKEAHFLSMMTAEELMTCVSVARFEAGGSLEICRAMLMYALQVCARTNHGGQHHNNNQLMSQIFCRLIESSPSRQSALDKVTEFEQWALSLLAAENKESSGQHEDSPEAIGNSSTGRVCDISIMMW